jgi:hypothetical protein
VQSQLDITPELRKEMQDYFLKYEKDMRHKSSTRYVEKQPGNDAQCSCLYAFESLDVDMQKGGHGFN